MGRSGYSDYGPEWDMIMYRGRVNSSLRGERGMQLLMELREALDALPEKKLCADDLQRADGACCAIGAIGKLRGRDMTGWDAEAMTANLALSRIFDVPNCLIREIQYENDDDFRWHGWFTPSGLNENNEQVNDAGETREQWHDREDRTRWRRMSQWVDEKIKSGNEFRAKRGWKKVMPREVAIQN